MRAAMWRAMPTAKNEATIETNPPRFFAIGEPEVLEEARGEQTPTSFRALATSDPAADARGYAGSGHDHSYRPPNLHTSPAAPRPVGFHVTLRLEDDRPLAVCVADLRMLARVVLEQGEHRGLIAFGAADNHLHAELVADRAVAGAFAHYVATSLRWRLALPVAFEPARIRPLVDQRHAYNTFRYVQRQDAHHALDRDPAREGTSLPDLLGLRVLPTAIARRVCAYLPRVRRDDVFALFPRAAREPAAEPPSVERLVEAASAAFALPDLRGHGRMVCRARGAVVHAATTSTTARALAEVLGVSIRTIQTLRAQPAEAPAVRAVLLQANLGSPIGTDRAHPA